MKWKLNYKSLKDKLNVSPFLIFLDGVLKSKLFNKVPPIVFSKVSIWLKMI